MDGLLRGILTPILIKSHNMRYVFILMVILCTSCGTALPTVKPYKLDVQQGNVVTSKMLLQLRPGMTKSQVRFIMGTPLIQDSFHGNRWDYAYQLRESGKITEQRRVILDFENELLKSVRGDVVPSGSDAGKSEENAAISGTRVVKPNAKPEEKSLMSRLKFWGDDEVKPSKTGSIKTGTVDSAPLSSVQSSGAEPKADAAKEVKSLLEIPVEAVVASESLASVATASSVPSNGKVESVKAESIVASVASAEPLPVTIPVYESLSGMLFDRTLKFVPEVIAPEVKPEVAAPRAGNKTPPKPKDLPAEGASGFFDRMLEKIGF